MIYEPKPDSARCAGCGCLLNELSAMRGALDALLEVAEQAVDTRRCSVGILRAINEARRLLAPNAEVTGLGRNRSNDER